MSLHPTWKRSSPPQSTGEGDGISVVVVGFGKPRLGDRPEELAVRFTPLYAVTITIGGIGIEPTGIRPRRTKAVARCRHIPRWRITISRAMMTRIATVVTWSVTSTTIATAAVTAGAETTESERTEHTAVRTTGNGRTTPRIVESLPLGVEAASAIAVALHLVIRVRRTIGTTQNHACTVVTTGDSPRIVEGFHRRNLVVLRDTRPGGGVVSVTSSCEDPAIGLRHKGSGGSDHVAAAAIVGP